MLQLLSSLLSFAAIAAATSTCPPSKNPDPHPPTQLSHRSLNRRVYLELDLQLSHAIIPDYSGTPTGPAVLAVYIEANGAANPSLRFDIRVLEYNNGVVLPTPYVEQASFPFLWPREEQTAPFVTHGPGIEIYPLGRTALRNSEIMDDWTGAGVVFDVLKLHPAINDVQDANNVVLYLVNHLNLDREGIQSNLTRVIEFVRGSRDWYRANNVRFYCEMPFMTYRNRARDLLRTFIIVLPHNPVLMCPSEVREYIERIAHKVTPPPPFDPLPGY
ncbi:hypothetical protein MMC26_005221 [Xylographa opegraphella]|nr:hypothetical protein [Xylographa opegraphella]